MTISDDSRQNMDVVTNIYVPVTSAKVVKREKALLVC